jgi:hypothetical protein
MITEAYVSSEVAKLLKEKGFNEKISTYYLIHPSGFSEFFDKKDEFPEPEDVWLKCPTHQMAVAWLREEKNILIYVFPVIDLPVKNNYTFYWKWDGKKKRHDAPHIGDKHNYESPEQATEAALKYSLENLI